MVFFNCNACGESLKKNQVEKHYQQKCRNCNVLSCVDCGQEFHGDEYEKHTKCISEEEKYSGKNYKPKANANKGELKQEQWINQVQEAVSKVHANPKLKSLLEQLKNYPNIPRKQAKFENFLSNSLRVRDSNLTKQAWNAISSELKQSVEDSKKPVAEVKENNVHEKNGSTHSGDVLEKACDDNPENNGSHKKKKRKHNKQEEDKLVNDEGEIVKKKRKHGEESEEQINCEPIEGNRKKKRRKEKEEQLNDEPTNDAEEATKKKGKRRKKSDEQVNNAACNSVNSGDSEGVCVHAYSFKWDAAVVGVLKRAPNNQLSVKKLRKKVLSEFNARGGDGKVYTEETLLAKFMHKVSNNKKLKVRKDIVNLVVR